MGRALGAAHEAGIVHRDIKPANVLLDDAGRVKVVDFGIAHVDTDTRLTKSGMLVGTPEYLSPEQCRNESLDGRCDVYALGAILYELLTGKPPHQGSTPLETLVQVLEGPVKPPRELERSIDPDLERICLKCLERDPESRYAAAATLAARCNERRHTGMWSPLVSAAASPRNSSIR